MRRLSIAALIVLVAAVSCRNQAPKDTIFNRCADQIENIYAACDYMRNTSSDAGCYNLYGSKNFALMMITDLHEDTDRLDNAVELLNGCGAIDAGVFLGDFQYWRHEPGYAEKFIDRLNVACKPFLVAFGNHDIHLWKKMENDVDVETAAGEFMLRSNDAGCYDGKSYGYKDFDRYNVRLIVLNDFDFPEDNNGTEYEFYGSGRFFSQAQIDWFIKTLETVPEGYTVIIGEHIYEPMVIDNEALDTHSEAPNIKFNSKDNIGNHGYMKDPVIADIVNAYKNSSVLEGFYEYTKSLADGTTGVNVKADFSATRGDFACYICGHSHHDFIGHNAKYPDQVVYVNDAGSCPRIINDGSSVSQYSAYARNVNGRSQDLITVLCLDPFNRRLNFVRIGADTNIFLEKTGLLSYPY